MDNTISVRMPKQAEIVEEIQQMVKDFKEESVKSQLQSLSAGLSTYLEDDINGDVVDHSIDTQAVTTPTCTGILVQNTYNSILV